MCVWMGALSVQHKNQSTYHVHLPSTSVFFSIWIIPHKNVFNRFYLYLVKDYSCVRQTGVSNLPAAPSKVKSQHMVLNRPGMNDLPADKLASPSIKVNTQSCFVMMCSNLFLSGEKWNQTT